MFPPGTGSITTPLNARLGPNVESRSSLLDVHDQSSDLLGPTDVDSVEPLFNLDLELSLFSPDSVLIAPRTRATSEMSSNESCLTIVRLGNDIADEEPVSVSD